MEIKQIVKCVAARNGLTNGKLYIIIGLPDDIDLITIINDYNKEDSYYKDRFVIHKQPMNEIDYLDCFKQNFKDGV